MSFTPGADQDYLRDLDRMIAAAPRERRQRLATYVRRYLSPLLVEDLFEQRKLDMLVEEREIARATVIIADVRGFTPQTLDYERKARGLRQVAELLERLFDHALKAVYEYKGMMGEFSGDRLTAVFGAPLPQRDDADRAVMAAIAIYENASRLNRYLRMTRQHHLAFDIGIGICTGGPIWIGDIGSSWRRELTMIGTTINLASRVEELTKDEEFCSVAGHNIILTESTLESLGQPLKKSLHLTAFPPRPLRGLGETHYRLLKLTGHDERIHPRLHRGIDTATQAMVEAIAQTIEGVQERHEALHNARQHAAAVEAELLASLDLVAGEMADTLNMDIARIQRTAQALLERLQQPLAPADQALIVQKVQQIQLSSQQMLDTIDALRHPFAELLLEPANLAEMLDAALPARPGLPAPVLNGQTAQKSIS